MTDIQPNQNIKINDQTYSVEINRIQVGEYGGRKISLQPLDANGEAQGIAIYRSKFKSWRPEPQSL